MMEKSSSLQSNMRNTGRRCFLSDLKTGYMWAMECLGVLTVSWLAQKHSASVHIGNTFLYNSHTDILLSCTCSVMKCNPGTSNIKQTGKWFPLSDPWPYHAESRDAAVLPTSTFLSLDRTPCAAGVNTYLNITVKQQATCASLVSLKSLHFKTVLEVYSTQCELQHLCGLLFCWLFYQAVPVLDSRVPTPVGVASPALNTRLW